MKTIEFRSVISLKLSSPVISRIQDQFLHGLLFTNLHRSKGIELRYMMVLPSVHIQLFLDCTIMQIRLVSLIVGIILSRSDVRIRLFYSNISIKYLIISFSSDKSGSGRKRKYRLEDWQGIGDFYRL